MGIIQLAMHEVPATIFLNGNSRQILFVKQHPTNFIDYTDGSDVVSWTKDALYVADKKYDYNVWHSPSDNEDLKTYFKVVLQDHF